MCLQISPRWTKWPQVHVCSATFTSYAWPSEPLTLTTADGAESATPLASASLGVVPSFGRRRRRRGLATNRSSTGVPATDVWSNIFTLLSFSAFIRLYIAHVVVKRSGATTEQNKI
jgi:hypothetical protein